MLLRGLGVSVVLGLSALNAAAQSPFQLCNQRFLEAMTCFNEACGPEDVLDLPPREFCDPRPCDEFLNSSSPTSGLEYSWCVEDHAARGGAVDDRGKPVATCRPNPNYAAAETKANARIACQQREWRTCDGDFIDTYKVGGGIDLMACQADMNAGKVPPR